MQALFITTLLGPKLRSLGLCLGLLAGLGISCQPQFTEPSPRELSSPEAIVTTVETPLPQVPQPHQIQQDAQQVRQILQQGGFLEKFVAWNGKALVVKFLPSSSQFRHYSFNTIFPDRPRSIQAPQDPGFFNPASTVKVGIAALALAKLNQLGLPRQTEYRAEQSATWYRFDDDIRRALVISDNAATNRLILWLGFDTINQQFSAKGLKHLVINRLMLNKGTLISSPAYQLRWQGQITNQPTQATNSPIACYEVENQVGNCATAEDLVGVLMRLVQPEFFRADGRFALRSDDRRWLQTILSRTPRQEGFDYPDNYCRFLSQLQDQIAPSPGRMLSKCGVALFSNTYVDSSYIETSKGEKYYIVLAVVPPQRVNEEEVLQQINTIAAYLLPRLD